MTTPTQEPVGSLATALAHAARLLKSEPALAEAQAQEIIKVVGPHPQARLLLGAALRAQGRAEAALQVLGELCAEQPGWPAPAFEEALAQAALGRGPPAIAALRRTLAAAPDHPQAWRMLGDLLTLAGDGEAADDAYARHIRTGVKDPDLMEAAAALVDGDLPRAEALLRAFLKRHPTDVAAIRMLAETGSRLGRYEDAQALLERCLELAPSFTAARHNYATVLYRQNKAREALAEVDRLLKDDPGNPGYRNLRAAALARLGEHEKAEGAYAALLTDYPGQPKGWMSYGHVLKTVGRQDDSIAAYRTAIGQRPGLGEAWWSLANLKTLRFAPDDVAAMQAQLDRADISREDRFHLHFALGKAMEDARSDEEAMRHYLEGARLRREEVAYDPEETSAHVRRSRALFTPAFLKAREGAGCPAPDPIFVVGLPRAGSTLIEQILASHSQVEGTLELPDIPSIARRLGGRRAKGQRTAYPEVLAELQADDLRALGEEYLERTRVHRRLGRPLFVDKMPNNFAHLGLIRLILPNARVIDARRHPLGCCFSAFKQHFARGQAFTYDLHELGRYYRDYVELMAHFDEVAPGAVHRVFYERMVAEPEAEIRALLGHCGLPFEEACLSFHETERAVRTASSEQVRQPIFRDAVEHWRRFEPWLDPLKSALGPALDAYPEAPSFPASP